VVPLIDLKIQHRSIASEIEAAVRRVCDNTAFILSDDMRAFEQEFAAYCGARYGIGVANGTEALSLALKALGVGSGDEVIVPEYIHRHLIRRRPYRCGPSLRRLRPGDLLHRSRADQAGHYEKNQGDRSRSPLRTPGGYG